MTAAPSPSVATSADPTAAPTAELPSRRLGASGPVVSAIGLGCMGMSDLYGPADRAESLATLRAALDAGVTLLDTADFYGSGHNELLLAEALRGRPRDEVVISSKTGPMRDPAGGWGPHDGRPAAIRNNLAQTLTRLGTDHVDVHRLARLDPEVPVEESVGAIADLVAAGWVRHVGLSEVGAATIRRAAAVTAISDVQIEYSLLSRGVEDEVLPACRELGIAVTAYGALSRGLLSGHWTAGRELDRGDFRRTSPRFSPRNLPANLALVDALRAVADDAGLTAAQLALAWVLSRGEDVVPLVGARTRERLEESLDAVGVPLLPEDLAAIDVAVPRGSAAGTRYGRSYLAHLDSERPA